MLFDLWDKQRYKIKAGRLYGKSFFAISIYGSGRAGMSLTLPQLSPRSAATLHCRLKASVIYLRPSSHFPQFLKSNLQPRQRGSHTMIPGTPDSALSRGTRIHPARNRRPEAFIGKRSRKLRMTPITTLMMSSELVARGDA
jgi:hypothetical protein